LIVGELQKHLQPNNKKYTEHVPTLYGLKKSIWYKHW